MKHGDLFKMKVHWEGGEGERIPAWANRVVQDEQTKIFSAQVWCPEPYKWKKKTFRPNTTPLLIYECHIGMGQDAEKLVPTLSLRRRCCHVSLRMVTTASRSWQSRSILIMDPSAIT